MDALVEDMKAAGVQEKDTQDRIKWRQVIRCGDPQKYKEKPKEEEEYLCCIAAFSETGLIITLFCSQDSLYRFQSPRELKSRDTCGGSCLAILFLPGM